MSSNIEIWVALSSSAVSALGSLLAWLQATRVARLAANSAVQLERTRASLTLHAKVADQVIGDAGKLAKALSDLWEKVQLLKELVQKLADADDYPKELTRDQLNELRDLIFQGYAQWGGMLQTRPRNAWHTAKSIAASLLDDEDSAAPRSRDYLLAMKANLTEIQLVISEERFHCYAAALHELDEKS